MNEGWIKMSKVCDGAWDCPGGSDEFLTVCKQHPDSMSSDLYNCASGGVITQNQECDDIVHCWDKSDELPVKCRFERTPQRGNCR